LTSAIATMYPPRSWSVMRCVLNRTEVDGLSVPAMMNAIAASENTSPLRIPSENLIPL